MLRALSSGSKKKEVFVLAIRDRTEDKKGDKEGLTFKKGDQFILKDDCDKDWWEVKPLGGKSGWVPPSFLARGSDFFNIEWISYDIKEDVVVKELKKEKCPIGAFMILPEANDSISIYLKLYVKLPNSLAHIVVHREGSAFRLSNDCKCFETLSELIEYHAGLIAVQLLFLIVFFDRYNNSKNPLIFSIKKNQFVTKWEYEVQDIKKLQFLDRGTFGEVHKGELCSKEVVALKTVKKMYAEDFLKESEIARPCKHPNVVETIGICSSELCIISEFLANGSLSKYMATLARSDSELSIEECLLVAQQIASGMEYLSVRMKIVHRDLAARNILVGETLHTIKVADFGQARSLVEEIYYNTHSETFPRAWTAPEGFVAYDGILVTQKGKITSAADVWSFGVVMWELFTNGQMPYNNIAAWELYDNLMNGLRLGRPEKCQKKIYEMMQECWNVDRKARPSFTNVRKFLNEFKIEADGPSDSGLDNL